MKHKRFKKLKPWNYLRELSIVIIGVAITLFAGNRISSANEKKNMRLQVAAIYTELEDNRDKLDNLIDYYQKHAHFSELLQENLHDPRQPLNDSIRKYRNIIGKIVPFTFKKGAYEMFLQSGAMKLLKDRDLLLNITESYALLEIAKEQHDRYNDTKMQLFIHVYEADTRMFSDAGIDNPAEQGLMNFHTFHSGNLFYVKEAKAQIEKTLPKTTHSKS